MRVTVSDLRSSRVPAALGICSTDPRLLAWANEAMQRLLFKGLWWGSVGRFRICATNSCITLPRQMATIETASMCGWPMDVHDYWFEFIGNGPGIATECSCWGTANYRGRYPTFADVHGTNKKLNFVCDLAGDVGKFVLALGYDENNNWIRTNQSGTIKDGELIAYAQSAVTTSTNFFSKVTDLQLPDDMTGQSWLYEYNNDTAVRRLIGHYQYDETRPAYARYFFPGLTRLAENSSCESVLVEVMAKLEFIPLVNDTDYLILGNIPALKEMMSALKDAEYEPDGVKKMQLIAAGLTTAVSLLDDELTHYLGDGRKIGIQMVGSSIGSVDPVQNFI